MSLRVKIGLVLLLAVLLGTTVLAQSDTSALADTALLAADSLTADSLSSDSAQLAAAQPTDYFGESIAMAVTSPHYWYMWVWTAVFLFLGLSFTNIRKRLGRFLQPESALNLSGYEPDEVDDNRTEISGWAWLFLAIGVLTPFVYFGYAYLDHIGLDGHIMEWLNLIVRWIHIVFGISWIGASFYFVFLENALNRKEGLRDELAGNLWAVHGGGFYYLEKYKIAPKTLPKKLHWFKYEAYFTWISGFALLMIVYYFNASSFLIDPNIADITAFQGVMIGVGSLIAGWIIYDQLCKSPLVKHQLAFALVAFTIATGFAYLFSEVFSPRAAYIHMGALLGTCMAANVFFTIIPGQKAMVKAAKNGVPLDPTYGKKALQRSLHNNYITFPVLFIMISNHFPSTFGHGYNWAILAGLALASAAVRHFLNKWEQGKLQVWLLPVATIMLIALIMVTAPPSAAELNDPGEPVSFQQAYNVITTRCTPCHSAQPTDDTWTSAPNGVMYDTPDQIRAKADAIMTRAVVTKTMPQNNKTGMLPEERDLLRRWIVQGMPD